MFQRILLPVDNSPHSDLTLELAISLAQRFGSTIVGFHVYAARLHEGRFRQLESSLPQKYQEPESMMRQRQVHATLILKGLELISQSYLQDCAARCQGQGVDFEERVAEGKNYAEIVREASNGYELVLIGAKGMGEEADQPVGSVCLRVARRLLAVDTLVVKHGAPLGGLIMVALDGSSCSQRGFHLALSLAKAFGGEVEAVAAYDPTLHNRIFRNLIGVLSAEAGGLFRLGEQEQLHQEVIDGGMAKLCQAHLDWAQGVAAREGVKFHGEVVKGKAAITIARYARERRPSLLVVGRFGSHQEEGMDIGSAVEALLLSSPSNLLIAANRMNWRQKAFGEGAVTSEMVEARRTQRAEGRAKAKSELRWTAGALERIERVPSFVQGMVVKSVEDYARTKGATEVTSELVDEAKAYWEKTGSVHL